MNRVRTIATAGIVAGSVAFAAALLSSGGVGASFVDAAEASASIRVADHLEGLETGCTLKVYFNGREIDLGSLLDLSHFGKDDGHGTFSATFDFDLFSPNTDDFDADWDVFPAGDLNAHTTRHGKGLSITFWWLKPSKDHHVKGSASLKFLCTFKKHNDHGDDDGGWGDWGGSGRNGGDSGWMKSNGLSAKSLDSVNSLDSLSANIDSDPSSDADDATDTTTETFSLEAVLDLAADAQTDPACETPATEPADPESTDPAGCTADDQTAPECAPGGADAADPDKCPPAGGDQTTTSPPASTSSGGATEPTTTPKPVTTTPGAPIAPDPTNPPADTTTSAPPATTTSDPNS